METVSDLLNEEALFIPSEKDATEERTYTPKVEGEYLGHITDTRTLVREFTTREGKNVKARIFNFRVRVAPENIHNEYTFTDRDGIERVTNGEPYVGWTVNGRGVFRFLEPTETDKFESNSENNVAYLRFCQALGMKIETAEREIGGKTVEVQILPTLKESDINGRPVTAVVGRHKDDWNDNGTMRPQYVAKFVKMWKDGKALAPTTANDHDLPF